MEIVSSIRNNLLLFVVLLFVFVSLALAATLPSQGGSIDTWGTTLNNFISTTLNSSNGYLNFAAVNDSRHISASVINGSHIVMQGINATHIVYGGVNGSHIAQQTINATHILPQAVNGSHIANTSNVSIRGLNVTGSPNATGLINYTTAPLISLMKVVLNVSSPSPSVPSFNVTDGDVNVNSTILLTLGVNGTTPGNYSCGVVNVSVGSFAVQCSNGVGPIGAFRFNYMLINVWSP